MGADPRSLSGKTGSRDLGHVLVTGAGGFIGRPLVRTLQAAGVRVRGFSRSQAAPPGAERVFGDIADAQAVRRAMADIDTVFHLAGLASVDIAATAPAEAFAVNVTGTQNVLEAARGAGVGRVVVLSTAHVYGRPERLPLTEDQCPAPGSQYAATKLAGDVLALGYYSAYGLETTVLRPTNVYGPGQASATVIPTVIESALAHARIRVRDPSVGRDFLYVDDVVAALLAAASSADAIGKALLLASGSPVRVAEIVRLVADLTGAVFDNAAGGGDCVYACARRAEAALGWSPEVGLPEGLARTVAWWRERMGAAEPAPAGP